METAILAEMCVIGCVLIDCNLINNVLSHGITPKYFECEQTKNCFEAILELASCDAVIDFVAVLNRLVASDFNDKEYKKVLFNCVESVPSKSRIDYYCELVVGNYKARCLKSIVEKVDSSTLCADNVVDVAKKLSESIYAVMYDKTQSSLEDIYSIGVKSYDEFRKIEKENKSDTGFKKIDRILKGLSPGNLVVLAARPKVGKTAFALSIAKNVALTGKTVAFFSLEMEKSEVYERLLACEKTISMNKIIDRKLEKNDIDKLENFMNEIKNLPIRINDDASVSVAEIKCQCKLIDNLGLVVVDYLQLIKPSKKFDNRNQEIGAISRELKLLACELKTPVLCLAQLNRATIDSKRPSPNDLRDSGEIEQNCNKLIMLWCVEKHLTELGDISSKTIGCDIALNRRGSTGVVLMDFNGEFMCFKEIEKKYEEKKSTLSWK